jgi:hypothetical protein
MVREDKHATLFLARPFVSEVLFQTHRASASPIGSSKAGDRRRRVVCSSK